MTSRRRLLSRLVGSKSFLIGILYLVDLIRPLWLRPVEKNRRKRGRGRPYVYSSAVMLRCFIVRVWLRIPSNNALHAYFSINREYNRRVMKACGLHRLPDRRTFDRRFRAASLDLKSRIDAMGHLFVKDKLIDPYIVSVDSTLLKAKGHIWHKTSMKKNIVPHSGIDTDARWGYSRTKGWIFGYKLHLTCSTGLVIVPLSADFTTGNIQDNQQYSGLTVPLSGVRYMDGDEGYDDQDLYRLSRERGFELICPITRYENTPPERLELIHFYESELGQLIYSWRSRSVEPLFQHIKDVFSIDPLPVRGFHKAESIILLSILVYQLTVYYNHLTGRPSRRAIKHMLGS